MSQYKKYVTTGLQGKDFVAFECLDIQTDKQIYKWDGDKLADYSYITEKMRGLTGKILTIVDASMPEGKQNKCVKDLIRSEFLKKFEEIASELIDQTRCCETANAAVEAGAMIETASAKEILGA